MEQILKQLQDPTWWFTAVFMALIVGVAANYLRDWLSSILARYFVRVRRKRHKRLVAMAREVRILKFNFRIFVGEGIRVTILLTLISVAFSCLLSLRILKFVETYKEGEFLFQIFFLIMMLSIVILGFSIFQRLIVFRRVIRELRRPYRKRKI